jgi:hypothetical protein
MGRTRAQITPEVIFQSGGDDGVQVVGFCKWRSSFDLQNWGKSQRPPVILSTRVGLILIGNME